MDRKEDVRAYFGAIDLLVMPSVWEGLPYTLLEAMAAGTPVVAFETGGIVDVIRHGENGLLAPRKNSAALARIAVQAADDRELRERLKTAGRQTVAEYYHIDQMIADTEALYREIIQ